MTYDIMTCDVMTYDVMTYDVITYDVMTYDVITYGVMTYEVTIYWRHCLKFCNFFSGGIPLRTFRILTQPLYLTKHI